MCRAIPGAMSRETPESLARLSRLEQGNRGTGEQTQKTSSSVRPRKRGARLPDDFAVTPEMVEWARERVPNVDGRLETEKFVNHWRSKTGKDATKLDWAATWRNWMLNARANPRASPNGQHERDGLLLNDRTIADLDRGARLAAYDAQRLAIEGTIP